MRRWPSAGGTPTWGAARLAVRRSAGVVKAKGAGERLIEGWTRRADPESSTSTRAPWRRSVPTGQVVDCWLFDPVRDSALVLSTFDGTHRHPERYSRQFIEQVVQAGQAVGEDQLPKVRLHDLRHTHATLLVAAGRAR